MVPLLPMAILGSSSATSTARGPSTSTMCLRSRRRSAFSIGSERTNSLVRRATPRRSLAAHWSWDESPTMISRLPPPRSKQTAGAGIDDHRGADGREDQARFLDAVDRVGVDASLLGDPVEHLVAVGRAPEGAGRAGQDLGRPGGLGHQPEPAHRRDGGVGGLRGDHALAAHDVAEAQHLLLAAHRREAAVRVDVGDHEVEGVRSEVHGGDAHRLQATGTRSTLRATNAPGESRLHERHG